jgi:hypothetical protein
MQHAPQCAQHRHLPSGMFETLPECCLTSLANIAATVAVDAAAQATAAQATSLHP